MFPFKENSINANLPAVIERRSVVMSRERKEGRNRKQRGTRILLG